MRWLLLAIVVPAVASAQIVPERELEIARSLYDNGKYEEALVRVREAIATANFTDAQRVRLHELAGLSAFNLTLNKDAQQHFLQLLRINPDYLLDPFAVPPAAIRLFEQVRKENTDTLNLVRQQITLRLEQEKRAAQERERISKEQDERRKRLDELSRTVTIRSIEKRSIVVALMPFGAGQFQQGRNFWGTIFAGAEGVLAITSLVAYFVLDSMFQPITYTWTDRLCASCANNTFSVTVRRIPEARKGDADFWRTLKIVAGTGFYVAWAGGLTDALLHHQSEIITESQQAPAAPAPQTSLRLNLMLSPSSVGAGFTLSF